MLALLLVRVAFTVMILAPKTEVISDDLASCYAVSSSAFACAFVGVTVFVVGVETQPQTLTKKSTIEVIKIIDFNCIFGRLPKT